MTGFDLDRESDHVLLEKLKTEELARDIENLRKVLFGNGDPSNSVVAKIVELQSQLTNVILEVNEIKFLLIGDVKRGVDNESLLDKVQHAQKTSAAAIKIAWIIFTAVLLELIARMFNLI